MALEVELSRKQDSDYLAMREFYTAWKRIYRVIWLVPKATDAERLAKKLAEVHPHWIEKREICSVF